MTEATVFFTPPTEQEIADLEQSKCGVYFRVRPEGGLDVYAYQDGAWVLQEPTYQPAMKLKLPTQRELLMSRPAEGTIAMCVKDDGSQATYEYRSGVWFLHDLAARPIPWDNCSEWNYSEYTVERKAPVEPVSVRIVKSVFMATNTIIALVILRRAFRVLRKVWRQG